MHDSRAEAELHTLRPRGEGAAGDGACTQEDTTQPCPHLTFTPRQQQGTGVVGKNIFTFCADDFPKLQSYGITKTRLAGCKGDSRGAAATFETELALLLQS